MVHGFVGHTTCDGSISDDCYTVVLAPLHATDNGQTNRLPTGSQYVINRQPIGNEQTPYRPPLSTAKGDARTGYHVYHMCPCYCKRRLSYSSHVSMLLLLVHNMAQCDHARAR